MTKKSGVSINFDPKKLSKDIANHVKKNKGDLPMKGKCPNCDKQVTFNFKNGKANCPKCRFELVQK
ncbi:hypothetical protein NGB30_01615 [Mammaliicoccus fleurettii]|uniref:hypothetical protein n=1 Tax=Mammaliicoccus fleurettii TaxID=150056 RepID=UPI002DBB7D19|nr:hypothetical protein [Mammaliicoccus fleurettii]MEB7779229.1 hypothetical protein [Mammaliicoccus fleurettii]